jgi:hypothetical protein
MTITYSVTFEIEIHQNSDGSTFDSQSSHYKEFRGKFSNDHVLDLFLPELEEMLEGHGLDGTIEATSADFDEL